MAVTFNLETEGLGSQVPLGLCNPWCDALSRCSRGRCGKLGVCVRIICRRTRKGDFWFPQYTKSCLITGPAKASRLLRPSLSSQACLVGCLPTPCRDAPLSKFRFTWIFTCSHAGFQMSVFQLGLVAAVQRAKIGWPKNWDAADNAASPIRAMLLLRAGSHRLLLMPGPGSKWMFSKHSRALPQPFRQK